ncbi:MAG: exodeoxyribonuclease VII large subunit, partial [Lysobacterales bacterium]
ELKAKLAAEGLFDAERKRALPRLPRRIAILTSPTGAAIRDVLSVLRRRLPLVEVDLIPVAVQGENAAAAMAIKLRALSAAGRHDVILLTRGGGSLEDLWAFNDEALARAIAASGIPVVSAVGHEVDFSISDFVADLRAATPSAAAELLVPDVRDLARGVVHLRQRLLAVHERRLRDLSQRADRVWLRLQTQRADQRLRLARQRLDQLKPRLWRAWSARRQAQLSGVASLSRRWRAIDPRARLQRLREAQQRLRKALSAAIDRQSRAHRAQLATLGRTLHAASPLATLARGYAILSTADGTLVRAATQVMPGDALNARLAEGFLTLKVESSQSAAQSD